MDAGAGDFVYIPAGEIHVEENASADEPLVVVLTRNCPDSHVVYMDDGPGRERRRPRALLTRAGDRRLPDLASVLAEHGLTGAAEEPLPNDGWSGARMTRLTRDDGARFVLKRDSLALDWIARVTGDAPGLREAPLVRRRARAARARSGCRTSRVARDGDHVALLMPDLTRHAAPLGGARRRRRAWIGCSARSRRCIATPWQDQLAPGASRGPTCARRVLLLTRRSAARYEAAGHCRSGSASGSAGTRSTARRRPPRRASSTTSPRTRSRSSRRSAGCPVAGLHGDLKLGNVGPRRRRHRLAHRLADDARGARSPSSSAGSSSATSPGCRCRRTRCSSATVAPPAEPATRPGRRTGTSPSSSACCFAAGARASTPRRAWCSQPASAVEDLQWWAGKLCSPRPDCL